MPPTRPVLRERYETKRRAIVETAASVIAERGYHGTSIGDLAEATGLAAGGLYHYIGSKEQLLVAICDELMEPLLAEARELLDRPAPPEQHLRELVRLWVDHVARHRDHMLVFGQERHVLERGPQWRDVRARRKAFEVLLDDVLRRGEDAGDFAFADRGLALRALLGMVNHTATWFRPRGRLDAGEVADGFCDLLLGRAG